MEINSGMLCCVGGGAKWRDFGVEKNREIWGEAKLICILLVCWAGGVTSLHHPPNGSIFSISSLAGLLGFLGLLGLSGKSL